MRKEQIYNAGILISTLLQSLVLTSMLCYILSIFFDMEFGSGVLESMNIAPTRNALCVFQGFFLVVGGIILSQIDAVQKAYIDLCENKKCGELPKEKVRQAFEIVCKNAGLKAERFDVAVANDTEMNAYALGNKYIVVTSEAAKRLTVNELAGILAHEVGHILHGDTTIFLACFFMNSLGWLFTLVMYCISAVLFAVAGIPILGWACGLIAFCITLFVCVLEKILKAPLELISLFGSRQDEYAADMYACEIGLGKELMDGLKFICPVRKKSTFLESLYGTHPDMDDRLERINLFVRAVKFNMKNCSFQQI